jgi:hypothetical protein
MKVSPKSQLTNLKFGIELEYIFPDEALERSDDQKILDLTSLLAKHGVIGKFYDYEAAHKVGVTPHWKIVPDESLINGFEVVSPPIQDLQQVRGVLNAMKEYGAKLSETTDFHVHMDATGRSVEQIGNVLKNFVTFEGTMDTSQPLNHRGNSNVWMQSNSAHFISAAKAHAAFDSCDSLTCLYATSQPATGLGPRVHKLNMAEHSDSISLEFRGHHGTLSAGEVVNWVRLLDMFVSNSFNGLVADPISSTWSHPERLSYLFKLLLNDDEQVKANFIHRILDQRAKSLSTSAESIYNKPIVSPYHD